MSRLERVRVLGRRRPRDRVLRSSLWALAVLSLVSWAAVGPSPGELLSPRRLANLGRFLREVRPRGPESVALGDWLGRLVFDRALGPLLDTAALATLAIALATLFAALFAPLAARNVFRADPFVPDPRRPPLATRLFFLAGRLLVRLMLVFLRALPEYLLAFLLLAVFGPSTWPLLLALALHNGAVLGRLDAEWLENAPADAARVLRAAGAGRTQILAVALLPLEFGKALAFSLYRWETCVREATVLGMLGVPSIGFLVDEARVRGRFDEMLVFVACAGALVVLADAVSQAARRSLRDGDPPAPLER